MSFNRGDEIEVTIDREGLWPDEGIAHLPDETMVVIFGAGGKVGESIKATVINSWQSPLGSSLLANANG